MDGKERAGKPKEKDSPLPFSFLFDIFLGPSYNQSPPNVKYMTVSTSRCFECQITDNRSPVDERGEISLQPQPLRSTFDNRSFF